jgi:hypothetical protein
MIIMIIMDMMMMMMTMIIKYIVTDLINALPGNSSVNTAQHARIEEAVFSVDPTDESIDWLDSDRILLGKPEERRPLGRPRRRWVDNIEMDLREIGWDGIDWIDLVHNSEQWRSLVNTTMNLRVQ